MYEELFPDLNTRTDDKVGFFYFKSIEMLRTVGTYPGLSLTLCIVCSGSIV